jgi:DNA polymerase alpha subunit A
LFIFFFKSEYIIPDKKFTKNSFGGKRKAAYSGGLVLEPQKGLYDKYVLLLDFNSLYPSIILENNLCFTTVERPRKEPVEELEKNKRVPPGNKKKGKQNNKKQQQQKDKEMTDVDEEEEAKTGETGEENNAATGKEVFEAQPPQPGLDTAILPSVIGGLIEKRRNAKKEMAKAARENDKSREWQSNIRQLALKLTANSTYGCLGFMYSRFYCQPIAELITRIGRQLLRETKDKIEQSKDLGYTVIYGDTDSVMVLTPYVQYDEAYKVGEKIQSYINRGNKHLEIGVDGLFRRMLLLRKKKYVAVIHTKRDGVIQSTVENKGIDIVRRDWCELSREVGQYCVDQILKTSNTTEGDAADAITAEDVVSAIHSHLREVRQEVTENQLPLSKFVITKGLTKAPEDYPDASHQPHVQVANEMRKKGIPVRVGQRIPYVIWSKCVNPNPRTIADRAVHPDIFEEGNKKIPGTYVVDNEWYLSQQIFPPVNRLCEHMEGSDSKMLADCLGLDKHKYAGGGTSSYGDINAHLDYVMMSDLNEDDDEKYKDVKIQALVCPHCHEECPLNISERIISHIQSSVGRSTLSDVDLLSCPNCSETLNSARITNWVTKAIREQLQRYYAGWFIVPHHISKTVGSGTNRTRVSSMTPKHGVVNGIIVSVREEFTAQDLQLHLQYCQSMFDLEKAFRRAKKFFEKTSDDNQKLTLKSLDKFRASLEQEEKTLKELDVVKNKVQKFLDKSARQWVQLDDLFSGLKVK